MFNNLPMSDWIEIIGIIISTITSIVAIIISIITLKQNNKMIKESTRPYITISLEDVFYKSPTYYLVIKNYGSTGATITDFKCDYDLKKLTYNPQEKPFCNIINTFIAPNQSFITALDTDKMQDDIILTFNITYKDNSNTYKTAIKIPLNSYNGSIRVRPNTENKELQYIFYTLENFIEHLL